MPGNLQLYTKNITSLEIEQREFFYFYILILILTKNKKNYATQTKWLTVFLFL